MPLLWQVESDGMDKWSQVAQATALTPKCQASDWPWVLDMPRCSSLTFLLYMQIKMISDPRQIGGQQQARAEVASGMTASVLDMFGCGANFRR